MEPYESGWFDSYQYDEKWGYFAPSQHLNVDQSPFHFSMSVEKRMKPQNMIKSLD